MSTPDYFNEGIISAHLKNEHPEKIYTREELCELIWGEAATSSHLSQLSSLIQRIRKKFNEGGCPLREPLVPRTVSVIVSGTHTLLVCHVFYVAKYPALNRLHR